MGVLDEPWERVADMKPVTYEELFLIDELLVDDVTTLSGEPGAGKSYLALGMVTALVNGESAFLGFPVRRKLDRVAYGYTDGLKSGGDIKLRLDDDAAHHVDAFHIGHPDASHTTYWSKVAERLLRDQYDMIVVDNMLGALPNGHSIADPVPGTMFARHMQFIADSGVPLLLLTHPPKGIGEGLSVASSPIGARAIGGLVRHELIRLFSMNRGSGGGPRARA